MQEVVKRMQERQAPKLKKNQFVALCLVKTKLGATYPVVLPAYSVDNGDLVWFPAKEGTAQGEIIYVGRCTPDSELWTGIMVAMQMEPVMAIKYAKTNIINWEEED